MKLITAVVKPFKIDDVKDALKEAGVARHDRHARSKGFGRQSGHTEVYRGAEYTVDFVPKGKIEVLCDDEDVDRIASSHRRGRPTGKIGDGKLWITDVAGIMRLRTGERDGDAI